MNTNDLKVGSKVILKKIVSQDKHEYTTQIQEIDGNILRVLTPMYKSILVRLHEGTEVELLAYSTGRVHSVFGKAGITSTDGGIYYTEIIVSEVKKIERRNHFRVKAMEDILIRTKNDEETEEFSNGLTIDLSAGGLMFSSMHCFEENGIIEMKLGIDEEELLLEGKVLTRVEQIGLASYKHTVEFLNLDKETQELIVRYVFKVQREKLRR